MGDINMGIIGTYSLRIERVNGDKEQLVFSNLVTDEGLALLVKLLVVPGTTAPQWFLGLKGVGVPTNSDTAGSHPTWAEVTGYDGATRPAASVSLEADGMAGRVAPITFEITEEMQVYGAFLSSSAGKMTGSGRLLSVGNFPSRRSLFPGDKLSVGYRFSQSR